MTTRAGWPRACRSLRHAGRPPARTYEGQGWIEAASAMVNSQTMPGIIKETSQGAVALPLYVTLHLGVLTSGFAGLQSCERATRGTSSH